MRSVNFVVCVFILISVALVIGQDMNPDATVAEVNGMPVTVTDVMVEMNRLTPEVQQQILADPNGKTELVNSILRRKLMVAEAKNFKVDTLPAVKKAVERSAEDIYVQVLLNSIQQQNAQVGEEEANTWYTENDTVFNLPTRYHLSQIVFTDQKTAEDALKQIKKGKLAWDDAIKKYPGIENNLSGDGGWLFLNQIVPQAGEYIKDLKATEISDVITIGSFFYVIKIAELEPPRKRTFDESKNQIIQFLAQQKAQNAVTDYQSKLWMQAKISTNNAVLNTINLGGTSAPPGGGR